MKKLSKKQIDKLINDPKRIDAIANEPHMVKWGKSNPWFGYDKKLTRKAIKIARELDKKGINGKTNKYWDKIDKKLGKNKKKPRNFHSEGSNFV